MAIAFFAPGKWNCSRMAILALAFSALFQAAPAAVFNVKDYGATGLKEQDARPAIQKAIDACASARGGTVLIPAGHFTSGTLHLCSNLHIQLDAGATLFAMADPKAYDYGTNVNKAALLFGEDLENVSFTGQGIVDGQAEYEWRPDDFEKNFDHKTLMQKLGKPILRPVPRGFPQREVFPHLIWLPPPQKNDLGGLRLFWFPH